MSTDTTDDRLETWYASYRHQFSQQIQRYATSTLLQNYSLDDSYVPSRPCNIILDDVEAKIFETIRVICAHYDLKCEPRVAGGWVRDKLLGKASNDIDIAVEGMEGETFAHYVQQYIKEFPDIVGNTRVSTISVIKSNPSQSKHLNTATFKLHNLPIDASNLRTEVYPVDSRIPIMQMGSPRDDVMRRDFTCNSLFYNIIKQRVEDVCGRGVADLFNRQLCTPLHSFKTFNDDPLRVLRCARFAARLGFSIDRVIHCSASHFSVHLNLMRKVSRERFGIEIHKMFKDFTSVHHAMGLLTKWGLRGTIFALPVNHYTDIALAAPRVKGKTKQKEMNDLWDRLLKEKPTELLSTCVVDPWRALMTPILALSDFTTSSVLGSLFPMDLVKLQQKYRNSARCVTSASCETASQSYIFTPFLSDHANLLLDQATLDQQQAPRGSSVPLAIYNPHMVYNGHPYQVDEVLSASSLDVTAKTLCTDDDSLQYSPDGVHTLHDAHTMLRDTYTIHSDTTPVFPPQLSLHLSREDKRVSALALQSLSVTRALLEVTYQSMFTRSYHDEDGDEEAERRSFEQHAQYLSTLPSIDTSITSLVADVDQLLALLPPTHVVGRIVNKNAQPTPSDPTLTSMSEGEGATPTQPVVESPTAPSEATGKGKNKKAPNFTPEELSPHIWVSTSHPVVKYIAIPLKSLAMLRPTSVKHTSQLLTNLLNPGTTVGSSSLQPPSFPQVLSYHSRYTHLPRLFGYDIRSTLFPTLTQSVRVPNRVLIIQRRRGTESESEITPRDDATGDRRHFTSFIPLHIDPSSCADDAVEHATMVLLTQLYSQSRTPTTPFSSIYLQDKAITTPPSVFVPAECEPPVSLTPLAELETSLQPGHTHHIVDSLLSSTPAATAFSACLLASYLFPFYGMNALMAKGRQRSLNEHFLAEGIKLSSQDCTLVELFLDVAMSLERLSLEYASIMEGLSSHPLQDISATSGVADDIPQSPQHSLPINAVGIAHCDHQISRAIGMFLLDLGKTVAMAGPYLDLCFILAHSLLVLKDQQLGEYSTYRDVLSSKTSSLRHRKKQWEDHQAVQAKALTPMLASTANPSSITTPQSSIAAFHTPGAMAAQARPTSGGVPIPSLSLPRTSAAEHPSQSSATGISFSNHMDETVIIPSDLAADGASLHASDGEVHPVDSSAIRDELSELAPPLLLPSKSLHHRSRLQRLIDRMEDHPIVLASSTTPHETNCNATSTPAAIQGELQDDVRLDLTSNNIQGQIQEQEQTQEDGDDDSTRRGTKVQRTGDDAVPSHDASNNNTRLLSSSSPPHSSTQPQATSATALSYSSYNSNPLSAAPQPCFIPLEDEASSLHSDSVAQAPVSHFDTPVSHDASHTDLLNRRVSMTRQASMMNLVSNAASTESISPRLLTSLNPPVPCKRFFDMPSIHSLFTPPGLSMKVTVTAVDDEITGADSHVTRELVPDASLPLTMILPCSVRLTPKGRQYCLEQLSGGQFDGMNDHDTDDEQFLKHALIKSLQQQLFTSLDPMHLGGDGDDNSDDHTTINLLQQTRAILHALHQGYFRFAPHLLTDFAEFVYASYGNTGYNYALISKWKQLVTGADIAKRGLKGLQMKEAFEFMTSVRYIYPYLSRDDLLSRLDQFVTSTSTRQ